MSYPERAALALVLFLLSAVLLNGCKTTASSEAHMAASAATTLDVTEQADTHATKGPTETTGRLRTFRPPKYPGESLKDRLASDKQIGSKEGGETFDATANAKSQERGDSTIVAAGQQSSSFDFLHGNLVMIGAAVVGATGIGVALWLWRRRKALATKAIETVLP